MGYSSGMLRHIVTIYNKKGATKFGDTTSYEQVGCVHADVTWKKGQKALNEGSLDSQDTVLIRMRWNNIVKRDSQLECDGMTYQITEFHASRQDNIIQIKAQEVT